MAMDYASWVSRTSSFLRGLTFLPGKLEVYDEIEEPATDDFSLEWLNSENCSAPDEVRAFLREASKRCWLRYVWRPPEPQLSRLQEIWPGREELTGGGDLCELARFSTYDRRDKSDELSGGMQPAIMEFAKSMAEKMAANLPEAEGAKMLAALDELDGDVGTNPLFEDDQPERADGLFAFLQIGDSEQLCLDLSKPAHAVFYMPTHARDERHLLSPSFDQFLTDWEALCYITPTPEHLAPWLEPDGLQTDSDHTEKLRRLLASGGAQRAD